MSPKSRCQFYWCYLQEYGWGVIYKTAESPKLTPAWGSAHPSWKSGVHRLQAAQKVGKILSRGFCWSEPLPSSSAGLCCFWAVYLVFASFRWLGLSESGSQQSLPFTVGGAKGWLNLVCFRNFLSYLTLFNKNILTYSLTGLISISFSKRTFYFYTALIIRFWFFFFFWARGDGSYLLPQHSAFLSYRGECFSNKNFWLTFLPAYLLSYWNVHF